jgi:hypothetical protein
MNKTRFLWLFAIIALGSALSLYFSSRKLSEIHRAPSEVVLIDAPKPNQSSVQKVLPKAPVQDQEEAPIEGGPKKIPGCTLQPEFKRLKNELGLVINKQDGHFAHLLEQINEFKNENGLPIPMLISAEKLEKQNIVYNNCRSSCGGDVHEVFVKQIVDRKFIQALTKDGKFQDLALGRGGVELAIVDELSSGGVPFRSWPLPASESDWYVFGTEFFYRLDIPGIWLKVNSDMSWELTAKPKTALHLEVVQETLSVKGCTLNEKCFLAQTRHFKAPNLCSKSP